MSSRLLFKAGLTRLRAIGIGVVTVVVAITSPALYLLPSLLGAIKLQFRAARLVFDWPSSAEVLDKIFEEAREVS